MKLPSTNRTNKSISTQNEGKQNLESIIKTETHESSPSIIYEENFLLESSVYVDMLGGVEGELTKASKENSITEELLDEMKKKIEEIIEFEGTENEQALKEASSSETPEMEETIKREYVKKRKRRKQFFRENQKQTISNLEKYLRNCIQNGTCPETFIEKLTKTIFLLENSFKE